MKTGEPRPKSAAAPAFALLLAGLLPLACTEPRLLPGDADGGLKGTIDAGPWTNATANLAGISSVCGNLSFVSAKPDEDMLIAGVAEHGLWASRDGGDWSELGQGAGSAAITNGTNAVVYDPVHPSTFWESGFHTATGVYRTDDDGQTFVALGNTGQIDLVGIDFTDPLRLTLLAGPHEQAGLLLRSIDGGRTWTDIGPQLPPGVGNAPDPLVLDAQTHLIGTYQAAGSGVFRTTDGGASWTRVYAGGVYSAPFVAHDGAIYWLLESDLGLIRSDDRGLTWTKTVGAGILAIARGAAGLAELPDGRIVSVGKTTLVLSSDRGVTWSALGPALPIASPQGIAWSRFRKALYVWHFRCVGDASDNMVPADAIQRLDFTSPAP